MRVLITLKLTIWLVCEIYYTYNDDATVATPSSEILYGDFSQNKHNYYEHEWL
jgi:hypothetical protein